MSVALIVVFVLCALGIHSQVSGLNPGEALPGFGGNGFGNGSTRDSAQCSPNNTLPALTWCRYNNPFILSDFLSRNSTDLTISQDSSKEAFQLSINCSSASGSQHRVCSAITQIRSATIGIQGLANRTSRLVIFTDLDGKMLFVNFNNNTMAKNIAVDIPNVKDFDTIGVTYTNPNNTLETVQDTMLLVANVTSLALVSIDGLNSEVDTCYIFTNVTYTKMFEQSLEVATFWPRRTLPNSPISMLWVWNGNTTLIQEHNGNPYKPWMSLVRQYLIISVPTLAEQAKSYIKSCPTNGLPNNVQSQMTLFALTDSKLKWRVHHNLASNMSFLVVNTQRAVAMYRIDYIGPYEITGYTNEIKLFNWNVGLLFEWCEPHPIINATTGQTEMKNRPPTTIFCVPNNETEITEVGVFSPDEFSHINTYRRDVFISVMLINSTHAFTHTFDLPELTVIPNQNSTLLNPLGLRSDFGTPSYPCDFSRFVWISYTNECMARFVVETAFEGSEPVSHVDAVPIKGSGTSSNSTSNSSTLPVFNNNSNGNGFLNGGNVDIPIPLVQIDHIVFFIARGSTVNVFMLYSNKSTLEQINSPKPAAVFFEEVNELHFLGNIEYLHASSNGQHLFAAVSRNEWELESQTRYLDICTKLTQNPNDIFLSAYKPACDAQPPRPVNLNTFTQYASYCSTTVYCPFLNEIAAELPQNGYYAERPAVLKPCPKGTFCMQGQKQDCPPGFYCDVEGLGTPKRCPQFPNHNMTCSKYGLLAPIKCDEGTVCSVNHIPGLPAPPGHMVPALDNLTAMGRSAFLPCPEGWWCNIGAQQPYNGSKYTNTTFQCPANTFCVNTSVLQPIKCQCNNNSISDGKGGVADCDDRTMYCPAMTTNVSWCPAGKYCTFPNVSVDCVPTQYCPNGTFAPKLCPAGTYCPTPAVSLTCPESHYCQRGSVVPTACNLLTVCPAGSESQSRSFLAPVVLVAVVLGVLVGFALFTRFMSRRDQAEREIKPMSAEARAFLLAAGDEDTMEMVGKKAEIPISRFDTPHISFDHMGLTLAVGEHKGKRVLDDVTGEIPPGSFVAVMGPSGSGKSTFMHTLAGKAFYGDRSGRVLVNGDEVDLNKFSKVMGFVKQDDIMLREMTVEETLIFNAKMRYDSGSVDTPEGIAKSMLKVLDLAHVRDINIGDEKKRGISGGQRKRVNIGMEMCALPCILFLDEPTSGLDSSSSMTVCQALRNMADSGITVIAVIHQPRYEIFQMFHKVLLLAKGGKLVYYGDPTQALDYFTNTLEIKCPEHVNPPDFFMDTISGENEKGLTVDDMVVKWHNHQKKLAAAEAKEGASEEAGVDSQTAERLEPDGKDGEKVPLVQVDSPPIGRPTSFSQSGQQLANESAKKGMAGFFRQLLLFTSRSVVQLSRDLVWFFTDLVLVLVAGFFLGLVFSASEYRPPLPDQIVNKSLSCFDGNAPPTLRDFFNRPIDDPIISEASLTCMAIGMTGVTAALRVFGNEQIVYWREASAGMSTAAYFFAKNISHLAFIVLSPLLYLAPFLTFVTARASFIEYYQICVILQFTTTGLGYLVSILAPPGLAQLAGVVGVLVLSMFGGARPTLPEIQKMFPLLHAMPYISYIRWGQEALYLQEIRKWSEIQGVNVQPSLDLFGYSFDDYALCVILTAAFGVLFRLLALIAMIVMNRDQKH